MENKHIDELNNQTLNDDAEIEISTDIQSTEVAAENTQDNTQTEDSVSLEYNISNSSIKTSYNLTEDDVERLFNDSLYELLDEGIDNGLPDNDLDDLIAIDSGLLLQIQPLDQKIIDGLDNTIKNGIDDENRITDTDITIQQLTEIITEIPAESDNQDFFNNLLTQETTFSDCNETQADTDETAADETIDGQIADEIIQVINDKSIINDVTAQAFVEKIVPNPAEDGDSDDEQFNEDEIIEDSDDDYGDSQDCYIVLEDELNDNAGQEAPGENGEQNISGGKVPDSEQADDIGENIKQSKDFKLTPPENLDELLEKMCTKRARKLIYTPKEVVFEGEYVVIFDKLNEEGIPAKSIYDAIINEGLKKGFLDRFDGLKTPEIKEEYAGETIYEIAEQELRKMGIIYENGVFKVYIYDWDQKGCHHIGYLDAQKAAESAEYFLEKDLYSFDLCGIITGGKAKHVLLLNDGKIKIKKDKGSPLGIELDVTVTKRKD